MSRITQTGEGKLGGGGVQVMVHHWNMEVNHYIMGKITCEGDLVLGGASYRFGTRENINENACVGDLALALGDATDSVREKIKRPCLDSPRVGWRGVSWVGGGCRSWYTTGTWRSTTTST